MLAPTLLSSIFIAVLLPPAVNCYDFFITSEVGFSSYFEDPKSGERYGMRFQNAVYNVKGGDRIGTNQGYSIWLPDDSWMKENYGNDTSLDSLFKVPTRTFFLKDGSITTTNEAIVGATGSYAKYFGGRLIEDATGTDPYEAEISLVLPQFSGGISSTSVHHGFTMGLLFCLGSYLYL